MNATFSVQLNPANPAEFFGACGLLELSSRRSAADGWFDAKDVFHLTTEAEAAGDPVSTALYALDKAGYIACETSSADSKEWRASPLIIGDTLNIRLDWWKSHESLKTFAGHQKSVDIYGNLLRETSDNLSEEMVGNELWNAYNPGVKGLGLDAYRSWTALSMGFSPNELHDEQQKSPPCRPAIELLAMIGLQRMRPLANRDGIEYWTWDAPLSAQVAGAAVAGQVEFAKLRKYKAHFQKFGQNKSYLIAEKSD